MIPLHCATHALPGVDLKPAKITQQKILVWNSISILGRRVTQTWLRRLGQSMLFNPGMGFHIILMIIWNNCEQL